MTADMPEPMDITPPDVMEVKASGVSVGQLKQNFECDYTLTYNQNIEMISTLEALKRYFRRAKKETLKGVYNITAENADHGPKNQLHIITAKELD